MTRSVSANTSIGGDTVFQTPPEQSLEFTLPPLPFNRAQEKDSREGSWE